MKTKLGDWPERELMQILKASFCAVMLATSCLIAAAHNHATGVVRERMEMMESMAKRMKAIRERVDRKGDLAAVKSDAEAIASQAPHLVHLFPPGSTQKPTDARSAIWQNWPDFERKASELEAESKKLMSASPEDYGAISAQVRAVTQTCVVCHEKYRTKRRKGDGL
jgi:cytochrome c556